MRPTARAGVPQIAVAVAAGAAAVVALAAAGTAGWLASTGGDAAGPAVAGAKPVLLAAVFVVPGLLISLARPRSALGWLVLGEAVLFGAAALGQQWVRSRAGTAGTAGADAAWAAWVADRFSALLAVGIWLVLVLLPDGRLPSARWRPVVAGVVTVQCLLVGAFALVRGPAAAPDSSLPLAARDAANPVGVLPGALAPVIDDLGVVVLQLPLLLCLAAYVSRLRRARPDERVRVVGVLLAASTFVLLVVLGHAWWPQAAEALDVLAGALLAAQLTATVLGRRPRVIGAVVRQTFLFTVLTVVVVGVAALTASLLRGRGWDVPELGTAVIAGAAALAVHPLRLRLAAVVDRLLYGDVQDPYRALQRLAEQTRHAPSVDAVLTGLAASVAASLRVPWASAEVGGHRGEWGARPRADDEVSAPLTSGADRLGTVAVAAGPGRRLHRDELRLLEALARHGGLAVQAALLGEALRAGRQRLVVTREEERRRLRRNLHDEVGPTLAGLTMQLGGVRALVHTEPAAAAERLTRLQDAAREALETVRRISHDLRPPALDELGLVGALRQLAESLGLHAVFSDLEPLPRLPAAVEVAAYRIGAEALHNVARHAGSPGVVVSVRHERGELLLSIRDAGCGLSPDRPVGVGLLAMRERADELGGSVEVRSPDGAGTTVTARLPVRHEAGADAGAEVGILA